ncbi:MAG: Uma2 family endonuclease [Hyphomicrobiaceae bacterium]
MSDLARDQKFLTVDEFLVWAEAQDKGRFELFCGEIVAMAPERAEHAKSKAHIWRALASAIEAAGLACEAYVDGLAVVIDHDTSCEPDALVNCGPPIDPQSLKAPSPVVVVEVMSPTSSSIDKHSEMADYFRVPTIMHCLLVDLGRRNVLHVRRAEPGDGRRLTVTILTDGDIGLDPPGLTLPVATCFG